ncbi:Gfo/Idh/MocA family protein [Flindersiella endophytica]
MNDMVRIGVIGTGVMGADHVRTLATAVAGAQVAAVSDLDTSRAEAAVEAAGLTGVRILDDPLKVVEDPDIDAVVVASADSTHEELVLACVREGKYVLCEKPLTPTADGSLRIVAAEVDRGRRLASVGFMRRYDPGYASLKASLCSGALGGALMLHCVHRNASSRPDTASEQLINGSAVHEFDVTRWLLDDEITRITVHHGRRSSLVVGGTDDPMLIVAETASGVLVDVEVFVNCRYGYDVRCELVGETGTLSLDRAVGVVGRGAGGVAAEIATDWRDRFADAYRLELQDWVRGAAAGDQRGPTAWDGYAATAIATAGVDALETGRPATVSLATRPDLYATSSD